MFQHYFSTFTFIPLPDSIATLIRFLVLYIRFPCYSSSACCLELQLNENLGLGYKTKTTNKVKLFSERLVEELTDKDIIGISVCLGMSQYFSVCLGMSRYVSVCLSMSWYVSVCLSMSRYVSVCLGMSRYVQLVDFVDFDCKQNLRRAGLS